MFTSGLNGGTITLTGSTLIVSERVTIQGPANGVRIQKGASSTATAGLRFENFDLAPTGLQTNTGILNMRISGFATGIELVNLTSSGFNMGDLDLMYAQYGLELAVA